eukprot:Phypoly_transcript_23813.p1 GENE.Phypoly_transcript_23813~~Phypoly_transcript_23813.p1  ORF type:complete len:175 (+),score=35.57 Phypoly_transcript_23813:19-543(+)
MDKPVTRKRQAKPATNASSPSPSSPSSPPKQRPGIPLYAHLILLTFSIALVLYFTQHTWIHKLQREKVITRSELAKHDGSDPDLPIYMGVNGKVYDVTAGRRHYGKQGSYNFFAGRDATRSFLTGCFDPNDPKCTVDSHLLKDPTEKQLEELQTWEDFYKNHKEYFYVGYIVDD